MISELIDDLTAGAEAAVQANQDWLDENRGRLYVDESQRLDCLRRRDFADGLLAVLLSTRIMRNDRLIEEQRADDRYHEQCQEQMRRDFGQF